MGKLDGGERGGRAAAHVEEGAAHDPWLFHQAGVFAPGQEGIRDFDGPRYLKNQAREVALVSPLRVQLHPAVGKSDLVSLVYTA